MTHELSSPLVLFLPVKKGRLGGSSIELCFPQWAQQAYFEASNLIPCISFEYDMTLLLEQLWSFSLGVELLGVFISWAFSMGNISTGFTTFFWNVYVCIQHYFSLVFVCFIHFRHIVISLRQFCFPFSL